MEMHDLIKEIDELSRIKKLRVKFIYPDDIHLINTLLDVDVFADPITDLKPHSEINLKLNFDAMVDKDTVEVKMFLQGDKWMKCKIDLSGACCKYRQWFILRAIMNNIPFIVEDD